MRVHGGNGNLDQVRGEGFMVVMVLEHWSRKTVESDLCLGIFESSRCIRFLLLLTDLFV